MQETKYQKTANRMDDALLELLQKKDYEYISIKEVCNKAGVNRSTFYLHYENMDDLLSECLERMYSSFFDAFPIKRNAINVSSVADLNFIKPEYLKPFLIYIKENKYFFSLSTKNPKMMKIDIAVNRIMKECISPVLDYLQVPQNIRRYIINYYLSGISGIISEWVKNDYKDDIDSMIALITGLVSADDLLLKHENR